MHDPEHYVVRAPCSLCCIIGTMRIVLWPGYWKSDCGRQLDTMLPEGAASRAFEMDVTMLDTFGSNARERTEGEFRKLATDAGFQRMDVIYKVDHAFVMQFYKLTVV